MRLKHVLIGLFVLMVAVIVAGYAVLSSLDINQYRDQIIAEAEKATGRTLRIDGEMDLKISLSPAVVLNDVGLSNAEWAATDEMVSVNRFELEVAILPLLSNELQIKRLVVIDPVIELETQPDGTANWALDVGEPGAEPSEPSESGRGKLSASFDEVVIEGGRITYRNGATGETLALTIDSLTAEASGTSSPLVLDFKGSYQEVPVNLAGSLSSLAVLTDPDQKKSIDLSGGLGGTEFTVLGTALLSGGQPSADIALTFKADDLSAIEQVSGAGVPPLTGIDVSTQVALSGQTLKLSDIKAVVANSDLEGQLTLVAGATPSVTGTIQSETIDLRDFAGEGAEGGGEATQASAPSGGDSPYVIPETPLPLDLLRAAMVDVNLSVGALVLNDNLTLEQTQGKIGLKDGVLTLTPLKTLLSDGRLQVNSTLNSAQQTPALDFGFTAAGVDYGKLLREQGNFDKMRGTIDADIAVAGSGASPRAIASTLNGAIKIEGGEGQLDDRLLKILTAGVDQLGTLFSKEQGNKLNCILVEFEVKNGLATSKAIVMDSEVLTVSGGGTIDLRTEELNLVFDTSTRNASLASLAVPFRVGGTMKNPRVAPDLAGTALGIAKTAGVVVNPVAGVSALLGSNAVESSDGGTACSAAVEQVQSDGGGGGVEQILSDPKAAIDSVLGGGSGDTGATDGATDGGSGDSGSTNPVEDATKKLKGLFGN